MPTPFPLPLKKSYVHESSIDYYLFTGLQSLDSLSTRMLEVSKLTLKLNKTPKTEFSFFSITAPFIVLLQNKHSTLVENGENLLSALYLISAQGG